MQLRRLEVGQLFEPSRTHYEEGVKFEFTQGGPILLICFNRPTEKEVESICSGNFTMKFYDTDNIIFMLFKFGSLNWIDAPYNIHLSPPFIFESMGETQGFGLQIYLINAATGILKVVRYVGLGHEFSIRLRDVILDQKLKPFDNGIYNFKINDIYKRYRPEDLAEFARWYYKTPN
jgi:hypothetical protein